MPFLLSENYREKMMLNQKFVLTLEIGKGLVKDFVPVNPNTPINRRMAFLTCWLLKA
ncbi:hypothetical protein Goklo_004142 [Gossypium klotzschianum]|uniref:Uncharacterized protein n=1 Tax=Gossypium klotzschianum TaxID=34286 RepID=A0A7J8VMV8_9ROSI|nr:hypothetical protein [Gossypium klotzschianum]